MEYWNKTVSPFSNISQLVLGPLGIEGSSFPIRIQNSMKPPPVTFKGFVTACRMPFPLNQNPLPLGGVQAVNWKPLLIVAHKAGLGAFPSKSSKTESSVQMRASSDTCCPGQTSVSEGSILTSGAPPITKTKRRIAYHAA